MKRTRVPNLKSVDWITSTTELVAFGISISSDRRGLLRGASNEGVLPTYRQVCNDHVLCWVVPSVCMVERLLRLKAIRQCHRSLYTHILPTVPIATHLRLRYSDWPTPRNKHPETRRGHKKISWVKTNTRGESIAHLRFENIYLWSGSPDKGSIRVYWSWMIFFSTRAPW